MTSQLEVRYNTEKIENKKVRSSSIYNSSSNELEFIKLFFGKELENHTFSRNEIPSYYINRKNELNCCVLTFLLHKNPNDIKIKSFNIFEDNLELSPILPAYEKERTIFKWNVKDLTSGIYYLGFIFDETIKFVKIFLI